MTKTRENRWNKYAVWKPLGLLVVAGLTPSEWEITILDENLAIPDYDALPRPDFVGITAFTSQANRAYEIAACFRIRKIPVVMGGIHATMRAHEAMDRVDAIVKGEAESVWAEVLADCRAGTIKKLYEGIRLDPRAPARGALLPLNGFSLPASLNVDPGMVTAGSNDRTGHLHAVSPTPGSDGGAS